MIGWRRVKDVKMIDNLSEFVSECGPEDYLVRCRLTRCNRGLDRGEGLGPRHAATGGGTVGREGQRPRPLETTIQGRHPKGKM